MSDVRKHQKAVSIIVTSDLIGLTRKATIHRIALELGIKEDEARKIYRTEMNEDAKDNHSGSEYAS
jgi:hypothetical protein